MAITPVMSSVSNQLVARYSDTDYAASLVQDVLDAAVYTPTTFNPTVLVSYMSMLPGEFTVPGAVTIGTLVPESLAENQSYITWSKTWKSPGYGDITTIINDIETWDMGTEADVAIPYLQQIQTAWREQTDYPIGLYSLIPWAQYAEGVGLYTADTTSNAVLLAKWTALINTYMRVNDHNAARLLDYVDFLCPRCYAMDSDWMDEWKYVTAWQILESIRIAGGKSVYPVLWFREHDSPYTDIPEADWITMLQFCSGFPGIAGIWIYAGLYTTTLYDWKDAVAALIAGTGDFAPA